MRRALFAVLAGAALARPARAIDVPRLSGRVNDGAHLLGDQVAWGLEDTLKKYEDRTGRQLVVLTLPSLEGEPIEEFSLKTARAWKLGRNGKNDGILVVIALHDRLARIEVGYGLEGRLPDALCGRIIRDEMAPRFRSGHYADGVTAAVNAIMRAADGNYAPPRQAPRRPPTLWDRTQLGLFVFAIMALFEAGALFGSSAGWVLYVLLIPYVVAFPGAVLGLKAGLILLGAHLIGIPILKNKLARTDWGKKMASGMTGGGSVGGRVVIGSGWSGGGLSSGGFSGGGGSFGGGGATGGW